MAVSAYMYFLFRGQIGSQRAGGGLLGFDKRSFRIGKPGFSGRSPLFPAKEGGVFRKRLLLSGEMLTSFSKRQGALVSCSFFIPVLK